MEQIKVKASKNYTITIDNGFESFKTQVLPIITDDSVAIITDSNVAPLYLEQLKSILTGKTVHTYIMPAGEENKNAENYINIVNFLAKVGLNRKSTVIGLGGGVVGDISAFSASTFMRGVRYIAVPTTLLSMVDSSVGGKTGIDLDGGKNLLGTFYQPDAVYINVEALKSLPEREITSGLGEIMKYAFIDCRITTSDVLIKDYTSLIVKSLKIKRDIVERDERESGERMLLNFGHTIGHAIEKLYDYKVSHGECVIKGMAYAIKISNKYGYLSDEEVQFVIDYLKISGVDLEVPFSKEEIISVMKSDKKASGDSVNFVFAKGLFNVFVKKVKFSEILEKM